MSSFDGKVVYITGLARGQGRSHAVRFAEEGAAIIGLDIAGPVADHTTYPPATEDDLAETVRLVEKAGGAILARQGDTRDMAFQTQLVADGVALFGGRLDCVIANAGILTWGSLVDHTEAQFSDVLDVNVTGTWKTLKATVPAMITARHGGSIVVVSSVAGLKAMPMQAAYTASKFALRGLAQSAAKELGRDRIRVNSIHPYAVDTPMAFEDPAALAVLENPSYAAHFTPILDHAPFSTCAEITDTVLFLCSDSARTITGSTFEIDQGNSKV